MNRYLFALFMLGVFTEGDLFAQSNTQLLGPVLAQTANNPIQVNAIQTTSTSTPHSVSNDFLPQIPTSSTGPTPRGGTTANGGQQAFASLTASDLLTANNQVITQVSTMYQHLGLFITIIVTLVCGMATWMSYVAKKTVHDFVAEWREKLNEIESDMNLTQKALHEALDIAKASALTASQNASDAQNSGTAINQTLKDLDQLKIDFSDMKKRLQSATADQTVEDPIPEPGTPSPQPKGKTVTLTEEAQVNALLSGKLPNNEGS